MNGDSKLVNGPGWGCHMKLFAGFYGPDFKEKRIQIIRIKIRFLKLLIIHFKKITFRINIDLNRIYSINILYNSCTANLENATMEEYQGLFHEKLINGKEEVVCSIHTVGTKIIKLSTL